jgi:hypothetical protein
MATSTSGPSASRTDRAARASSPTSERPVRFVPAFVAAALLVAATSAAPPAHAADPTISDCLTAAEASLKLRADHKLRLTRTQLLVCASPACPGEIRQECMKRIDEVNAAAPTLVLAVKNTAGHELVAVKVTVDGQVMATHLDGSALAIDPGAHEFTFEASGLPPLTQTIILHEGEKDRREVVVLRGTSAPASATGASAQPDSSGGASSAESAPPGAGKGQRVAGAVLGAFGIAGLAGGGVFGVLASSGWKSAQNECPGHAGCSPQAIKDRSNAVTEAMLSTVGFIAGGVLLAGGVTIYLTAPKSGSVPVGLEVRPGGLALQGGF